MRCHFIGHRLCSGWQPLYTLLRGRSAAARVIATNVGGALMLLPAGSAWPTLSFADVLTSGATLDWVKGSLGLMFYLWRRLGTAHIGQR